MSYADIKQQIETDAQTASRKGPRGEVLILEKILFNLLVNDLKQKQTIA